MKHIINDFIPLGGKHCVTNALKQIFNYYGYPVTEELILGVASGISFAYLNLAKTPMVLGRSKPFIFEQKVAERFNVSIKCKQSKSIAKTIRVTKSMIDSDIPVLIYVDMPFMSYLDMDSDSHFGCHAVVLFGYDDEMQVFYVSDRDDCSNPVKTTHGKIAQPYHTVSYSEIEKARSSVFPPFPVNNKYLEFDFSNFKQPNTDIIKSSVLEVCNLMLNPPAHLFGIEGIEKFNKEIKKWSSFDELKLKSSGYVNYYQINGDGGTGGGIFRNMYGLFLKEISYMFPNCKLDEIGNNFIENSMMWDSLSDKMKELSETSNTDLLDIMSEKILNISKNESLLFTSLQNTIS